jgi:hypothetical protein
MGMRTMTIREQDTEQLFKIPEDTIDSELTSRT